MRATSMMAVLIAAGFALSTATAAEARGNCVRKAGHGWGITKEIAQFQSFEIIQQVTGNWPFQTDYISKPVYSCTGAGGSWDCIARANVCKK